MIAQVSPVLVIWAVVAAVPAIWAIATVNRLVRLGNHIRESWANIDVCLRRRHDLIPNLVETVRGYMQHEREVLAQVIEARGRLRPDSGPTRTHVDDENRLARAVNQLLACVEAYPQLHASANFLALQRELVETEDRIAAARRFYNANVREHNTLVDQFPSLLVARLMNRRPEEYFEVEPLQVRAAPSVGFRGP